MPLSEGLFFGTAGSRERHFFSPISPRPVSCLVGFYFLILQEEFFFTRHQLRLGWTLSRRQTRGIFSFWFASERGDKGWMTLSAGVKCGDRNVKSFGVKQRGTVCSCFDCSPLSASAICRKPQCNGVKALITSSNCRHSFVTIGFAIQSSPQLPVNSMDCFNWTETFKS